MCGRYALGVVCPNTTISIYYSANCHNSECISSAADCKNEACLLMRHPKTMKFAKHTTSPQATSAPSTALTLPLATTIIQSTDQVKNKSQQSDKTRMKMSLRSQPQIIPSTNSKA